MRPSRLIPVMAVVGMALASPAPAQDLLTDALGSFPANTLRVEYSSPAKLRRLPNYSTLHQRYLGPRLAKLEEALGQLGVEEEDVDELIAGWAMGGKDLPAARPQGGAGPAAAGMDLYGLASGRFDAARMAREAAAHGVSPTTLGGLTAYCIQVESVSTCTALFGELRGAFGPRALLSTMIASRDNPDAPTLRSQQRFAGLVREARTDAAIWGAATGAAIPDTVAGWLPGQENLQLNWPSVFRDVWGLAYSMQVADNVLLRVTFDCTTEEAALNLRQVLEGVKVFQQMAWQSKNPSQPNPFSTLEISTQGQKVQVQLASSLAALGSAGPAKTP